MTTISANLQAVRARIAAAAELAGQAVGEVLVLAASKTFPAERIREAVAAGQRAFGENYVQEGLAKIGALDDLALEWHFIGPLQSNKTRPVAEHFDWVHGIERLKIAERLSAARGAGRPPCRSASRSMSAARPARAESVPRTRRHWHMPWPDCQT